MIGLFVAAVPHNGWWVGAGVLAVLLGVTAASPVIGRPFLRATGAVDARLFGPIGRLAGQNSLRNPRRTTATASALMIGLTLAFTVAILGSSAKASVDKTVEENFVGDFIVSSAFGEGYSPAITDRMAEHRRRRPGAARAVRLRPATTATGDATSVVGTDAATRRPTRPAHGLRPGRRTSPTTPCW